MRKAIVVVSLVMGSLVGPMTAAVGQVSIGINVPVYPRLVQVPNYPVYYAPGLASNYFFYDGLYWCRGTFFKWIHNLSYYTIKLPGFEST